MADLINIPLGTFKKAFLASPINAVQTEQVVLDRVLDIDFDGTVQYLSILDPDSPELISFTGQNNTGELTGVTRGLPLKKGGDSSAGSHSANISVALSNPHQIFENIQNAMNSKLDESGGILEGKLEFTGADNPGIRVAVLTDAQKNALADLENGHIVFVTDPAEGEGNLQFYGNGVWTTLSEGGAFINATENLGGKVELATIADQQAQTALGDSGSPLVMQAKNTTTTSAGVEDAGKSLLLNADGKVDDTTLNETLSQPSVIKCRIPYVNVTQVQNGNYTINNYNNSMSFAANKGSIHGDTLDHLYNNAELVRGIPVMNIGKRHSFLKFNSSGLRGGRSGRPSQNTPLEFVQIAFRVNTAGVTYNVNNLRFVIGQAQVEVRDLNGSGSTQQFEMYYVPVDENGELLFANATEIFDTSLSTTLNSRVNGKVTLINGGGNFTIKDGDYLVLFMSNPTADRDYVPGGSNNGSFDIYTINNYNNFKNNNAPLEIVPRAQGVNIPVPQVYAYADFLGDENIDFNNLQGVAPVVPGFGTTNNVDGDAFGDDQFRSVSFCGLIDKKNNDGTFNVVTKGRYNYSNTFRPGVKLFLKTGLAVNTTTGEMGIRTEEDVTTSYKNQFKITNPGASFEDKVANIGGDGSYMEIGYAIDNNTIYIDPKPMTFTDTLTVEENDYAEGGNANLTLTGLRQLMMPYGAIPVFKQSQDNTITVDPTIREEITNGGVHKLTTL